jgi:hypothetical protein
LPFRVIAASLASATKMAAPSRSQPTAYSARLTLNHQRLANAPILARPLSRRRRDAEVLLLFQSPSSTSIHSALVGGASIPCRSNFTIPPNSESRTFDSYLAIRTCRHGLRLARLSTSCRLAQPRGRLRDPAPPGHRRLSHRSQCRCGKYRWPPGARGPSILTFSIRSGQAGARSTEARIAITDEERSFTRILLFSSCSA